ncbi:MAG TPA: hypothetical protein VGD67_08670 [Pseudonocardiaceae bacterium]
MSALAEPETLADLISGCADLPAELRPAEASELMAPTHWAAGDPPAWLIDDTCLARVAGMDDYGS